ncbi:MAG: glucuronate isomerase [Planctomycetota bacterium]
MATPTTLPFINDDFLLQSDAARRLYHDHAADQPIYDYHCHLPPADLASNRTFGNLFEAWLEGDHYKWRAMRAHGVDERFCTGDAEPLEKFRAFARTVPATLGNPLYHWTHLELRRYFDIDLLLNEDTAGEVWDEANAKLATMPVSTILDRFKVRLIGTTDDPADGLEHHEQLQRTPFANTQVVPAFRPDKAYTLDDLGAWNAYLDALGESVNLKIRKIGDLLDALAERHAFFHAMGSRLSDHGLECLPDVTCSDADARDIFDKARGGASSTAGDSWELGTDHVRASDRAKFVSYVMLFLAKLDTEAGWTKQLHLGASRNNNGWAKQHLGPDTGFDSIGDFRQGPGLKRYLGTLAERGHLPQMVLYNLNPADNFLMATMAGNFNLNVGTSREGQPAAMQFGSGWWFLDQKDGMRDQMKALANLGLLRHFVGMLTDSRSFLSYPRHEYFRRTLCGLLGEWVEAGELPNDLDLLGPMVEDICYGNAAKYFGM